MYLITLFAPNKVKIERTNKNIYGNSIHRVINYPFTHHIPNVNLGDTTFFNNFLSMIIILFG